MKHCYAALTPPWNLATVDVDLTGISPGDATVEIHIDRKSKQLRIVVKVTDEKGDSTWRQDEMTVNLAP